VDTQLAKKNLKKSDSDTADLLICYHSNFGTKQIKRYTMYEGESTYSWTIKTGQVSIDMVDSSTKVPVWQNCGHQSQDQTSGYSKDRLAAPEELPSEE